jgi:membrane dipeptidase
MLPYNGGIVLVNFYIGHLSEPYRQWSAAHSAEAARLQSLLVGQPEARTAQLKAWEQAHPAPTATVGLIADHIDHIASVAGHDHVGIGGDLDGIGYDEAPSGMNSVSGYPLLFAELIRRGWSDSDLKKLAGGNLLRVMRRAEAVARSMRSQAPAMSPVDQVPADE